jgi:hypothetical protein
MKNPKYINNIQLKKINVFLYIRLYNSKIKVFTIHYVIKKYCQKAAINHLKQYKAGNNINRKKTFKKRCISKTENKNRNYNK